MTAFQRIQALITAIATKINELYALMLPEAPEDGKTYGRKDGDWEEVTGGSGTTPKEEVITGTRQTANISGSTAIDWNAYKLFQLTLTANATITDSNLPTGTATKVIEMVLTGDFTLTLPAYWEAMPANDDYDGTVRNHLVISCINGTTSSEDVIYSLQNLSS